MPEMGLSGSEGGGAQALPTPIQSPGLGRGTRTYPGSISKECINHNVVVSLRLCAPMDTTPLELLSVPGRYPG